MWKWIKETLSYMISFSMLVSCVWLVKLIVINMQEWKGSTFDFFYEYKISVVIALSIIGVGIFLNTKGRED